MSVPRPAANIWLNAISCVPDNWCMAVGTQSREYQGSVTQPGDNWYWDHYTLAETVGFRSGG